MSDPMTNVEIDDVLSAIRRLVSQESTQTVSERPGRLLLTPAQRVDEAEPEVSPAAARPAAPAPRVEVRAEPEPAPEAPAESLVQTAAEQEAPEAAAGFVAPSRHAGSARERLDISLEETVAALEAAVARQVLQWEPDGSETEPSAETSIPDAKDLPFVFASMSRGERQAPRSSQQPPRAPAERPAPPSARPAMPTEPYMLRSVQGFHHRPATQQPRPAASAPQAAPRRPSNLPIERAALRELIVEVLREELRGELGERITRNVRKLVRREIAQVIAQLEVE